MSDAPVPPVSQAAPGYSSIVVATDFSSGSAAALRQAMRIAAWSGAGLHVVHVIDTVVVIELEEALTAMQEGVREGLVRDAESMWKEFAAAVPGAANLPFSVSINARPAGILRRAREHAADLLVLGAYGERGPAVGVGTVATACVRKAMSDVLLVRQPESPGGGTRESGAGGPGGAPAYKRIIAAVDFSDTSRRALARAATFAAHDGADLHVLHVFEPPWRRLHYRSPTPEAAPYFQKQYRDGLEHRLAEFAREAVEAAGHVEPRPVLFERSGHRSGIVEYAEAWGADLLVLGTRGRTNLRDVLLGSTAEKAIEQSHCAILAVKPLGFVHPLAQGAA